jgi:hypothetical protein
MIFISFLSTLGLVMLSCTMFLPAKAEIPVKTRNDYAAFFGLSRIAKNRSSVLKTDGIGQRLLSRENPDPIQLLRAAARFAG